MTGRFIDTNIIIYAFSHDLRRNAIARRIIAEGGTISVQVLNEVANVFHRKLGRSIDETRHITMTLRQTLDVVSLHVSTHALALAIMARHRFSLWDGLIAAAALEAGCTRLVTEDLQDGFSLDGQLTVVNPFA